MQFLERQIYMVENLLSYRTRIDSKDMSGMLAYVERNLDALNLTLNGNIILKLCEIIAEENRKIFGVELLFPVNKPFESKGQCIYKPLFKLENAVSSRFYGSYSMIPEIEEQVYAYIKERHLKPVTDVYYIIQQKVGSELSFDTYVGINSNVL